MRRQRRGEILHCVNISQFMAQRQMIHVKTEGVLVHLIGRFPALINGNRGQYQTNQTDGQHEG